MSIFHISQSTEWRHDQRNFPRHLPRGTSMEGSRAIFPKWLGRVLRLLEWLLS